MQRRRREGKKAEGGKVRRLKVGRYGVTKVGK